ncbi:MAG: hypothetical protein JWM33_2057, partial [Caulobacteraceae bacterium]|nr:hypothetical protein [Caulobacteraceae bacterium]
MQADTDPTAPEPPKAAARLNPGLVNADAIPSAQSGLGTDFFPVVGDGSSTIGLIDTDGDTDAYLLRLTPNTDYHITLVGSGSQALDDPYLALFNLNQVLLYADDDSGPGLGSSLYFSSGNQATSLYVSAQAFSGSGQYTLSIQTGQRQNPLATIDWGAKLSTTTIAVYFAQGGESVGGLSAERSWGDAEKTAFMAAAATYENVTNLHFVVAASRAAATVVVALNHTITALGQMSTPDDGAPASGIFDPTDSSWTATGGLSPGGSGFTTLVHEIGHLVGLAHPHDAGGESEVMQEVVAPFGSYGVAGLNIGLYTVMSYNDGDGRTATDSRANEATPMALDIAVLQQKYGAAPTHAGDDVYALTDAMNGFYGIWDSGGTDSISYAGSQHAVIDLHPATLLNAAGGGGELSSVSTNTNQVYGGYTIAAGVFIENASGGSGQDFITGNDLANILLGNDGGDDLSGAGGDDLLYGGADNDSFYGGLGIDRIYGGAGISY